jgi:hypothetical protein
MKVLVIIEEWFAKLVGVSRQRENYCVIRH